VRAEDADAGRWFLYNNKGNEITHRVPKYTQSSVLRNANLRNHDWWRGARKRINQKSPEPGNAITPGDPT
jgi:hypothetical protein